MKQGKTGSGIHSFILAVQHGELATIKNFIEKKGQDVNEEFLHAGTALSIAINLKDEKITEYLLSKGAKPNSAIAAAAMEGNIDGLKKLLNAGAYINDKSVDAPLVLAAMSGRVRAVEFLLKNGADADIIGVEGKPALPAILLNIGLSTSQGDKENYIDILKLLVKYNVNTKGYEKAIAEHYTTPPTLSWIDFLYEDSSEILGDSEE